MTIYEWLTERNIPYNNKQIYETACCHTSYLNEHKWEKSDNERLEFLGDAVLQLWVSNRLFRLDPAISEGKMTTSRAQLVCEASLAMYSRQLGWPGFLKLGVGEEKSGGRDRDSIIANEFEALIGAIYYDCGLEWVDGILEEVIVPHLTHPEDTGLIDYKTQLQEYVQADTRKNVTYECVRADGPSNAPEFEVIVKMDEIILGRGIGKSKKKAEQLAAKDAVDKMAK